MNQTLTCRWHAHRLPRIEERLRQGELTAQQVDDFRDFLAEVDRELLQHRIIIEQRLHALVPARARPPTTSCKHFIKQFSVFSNQFLIAALLEGHQRAVAGAGAGQQGDPDERAGRDLPQARARPSAPATAIERRRQGPRGRPGAGQHRGHRGRRRLPLPGRPLRVAAGRRRAARAWASTTSASAGTARPSTLFFCDELQRACTAATTPQIAEGASFAVENWAAAGFWQELEDGLMKHQAGPPSPSCSWPSSPGTTASRASTPATRWRSWKRSYFDAELRPREVLPGRPRDPRRRRRLLGRPEEDRLNKVYV